jgi:hypothetical protein
VLLCWKLDRLGRSLQHLVNLLADLEALGISFVSLRDNLELTTPSGAPHVPCDCGHGPIRAIADSGRVSLLPLRERMDKFHLRSNDSLTCRVRSPHRGSQPSHEYCQPTCTVW